MAALIPLNHIYDEFNTMNQSLSLLHMLKYHFTLIHYYNDNAEAEGSTLPQNCLCHHISTLEHIYYKSHLEDICLV